MAIHRLPIPGSDSGSWGDILNDFLRQSHTADGGLGLGTVGTGQLQDGAITDAKIALGVRASLATVERGQTVGASGTAYSLDLSAGTVIAMTLTANCTFTFPSATPGIVTSLTLELLQDGTGSRMVSWPATVKWAGGVAPVLSTASGALDILTFYTRDGGVVWRGFLAAADIR